MAGRSKGQGCLNFLLRFSFLGYVAAVIMVSLISVVTALFSDDTKNLKLADGFTISSYNVCLL